MVFENTKTLGLPFLVLSQEKRTKAKTRMVKKENFFIDKKIYLKN